MRRLLILCAGTVVFLGGCGTADDDASVRGPFDAGATMRPDLVRLDPSTVAPGERVEASFPEETLRGVAWVLEEESADGWELRYYLTSAAEGYDAGAPSWWAVGDEEGRGWHDVGIGGPGPDTLVLPDTATPGPYRLCTANSLENICAPLEIRD